MMLLQYNRLIFLTVLLISLGACKEANITFPTANSNQNVTDEDSLDGNPDGTGSSGSGTSSGGGTDGDDGDEQDDEDDQGSLSSLEVFRDNVQPQIEQACSNCHGVFQSPLFAYVDDYESNHNTIIDLELVDFENPGSSMLVTQLQDQHNCFPASLCQTWANQMLSAVEVWANAQDIDDDDEDPIVMAPMIEADLPLSLTRNYGDSLSLMVLATGEGLSYQWYFRENPSQSFEAIFGENDSLLSITSLNFGHQGQYQVVVTNSGGSVSSVITTLSVVEDQSPILQVSPSLINVEYGSEFGEAEAFAGVVAAIDPPLNIDLTDEIVVVGVGQVNTSVPNDYLLTFMVTDSYQNIATANRIVRVLEEDLPPPPEPPIIVSQPQNIGEITEGDSFSFTVQAQADNSISYQWFKENSSGNFVAISGATNNIYSVSNAAISDSGNYHLSVTANGLSVTSNTVSVSVVEADEPPPPPTTSLEAFTQHVQPRLEAYCSNCHGVFQSPLFAYVDNPSSNHDSVLSFDLVNFNDIPNSALVARPAGGHSCPPNECQDWAAEMQAAIEAWAPFVEENEMPDDPEPPINFAGIGTTPRVRTHLQVLPWIISTYFPGYDKGHIDGHLGGWVNWGRDIMDTLPTDSEIDNLTFGSINILGGRHSRVCEYLEKQINQPFRDDYLFVGTSFESMFSNTNPSEFFDAARKEELFNIFGDRFLLGRSSSAKEEVRAAIYQLIDDLVADVPANRTGVAKIVLGVCIAFSNGPLGVQK